MIGTVILISGIRPDNVDARLLRHLLILKHELIIVGRDLGLIIKSAGDIAIEESTELNFRRLEDLPRPQELTFQITCLPYPDDMEAALILEQGLLEYVENRYEQLLVPIIPKIRKSQSVTTPFLSGRPPPLKSPIWGFFIISFILRIIIYKYLTFL